MVHVSVKLVEQAVKIVSRYVKEYWICHCVMCNRCQTQYINKTDSVTNQGDVFLCTELAANLLEDEEIGTGCVYKISGGCKSKRFEHI